MPRVGLNLLGVFVARLGHLGGESRFWFPSYPYCLFLAQAQCMIAAPEAAKQWSGVLVTSFAKAWPYGQACMMGSAPSDALLFSRPGIMMVLRLAYGPSALL